MHRETYAWSFQQQTLTPFIHLWPAPASNGTIVDRPRHIGHHKTLVYAYRLAEALTLWAGSVGAVEIKHLVGRLDKCHPIGLKPGREIQSLGSGVAGGIDKERHTPCPLEKSRLDRVGQSAWPRRHHTPQQVGR